MPSKLYVAPETAITWRASAGSAVLTLTSLAAGNGRQGAFHGLDVAASRSGWYSWRFFCVFATAPVVAELIKIYLKTSDGTNPDNDDGVSDAAVSAEDKLRNLDLIGIMEVDEASATPTFVASGSGLWIPQADVAPVIWNGTADDLSSTASEHGFDLVPDPPENQ